MKFDIKMALLAVLVVSLFLATAVAISFQNFWLVFAFFFGGMAVMVFGLRYKKKHYSSIKK